MSKNDIKRLEEAYKNLEEAYYEYKFKVEAINEVFVIICDWDNGESYHEECFFTRSSIVGVFETFDDAQNAFDDVLKQRQEYIDKINTEIGNEELKIIDLVRKPGYMYFGVENDEWCSERSNNTYKINKFTLGEIEKYGESYTKEESER